MTYMLLRGSFVIRYDDQPRQGPQPDGDTVKFRPDNRALVETLPRPSGAPPDLNSRGISVRLEAIDALETHFEETHQELAGARLARDELLAKLGFTNVVFFPDAPNSVQSADQDEVRGHVLTNGIDANGRMIGFVFAGDHPAPDGTAVFVDDALVDQSVNGQLLAEGLVYPAFYSTLPASLRDHLSAASTSAREGHLGLWPRSTADVDGAATVADLTAAEELVIWPKLFRRVVPYLAAGFGDFDGFDAWLRADPVNRDDAILLLDQPQEHANLHDVIRASGHTIQLTRRPEQFVILPDPSPNPVPPAPAPVAGSVVVVAALPDPVGPDQGAETVTLLDTLAVAIDLTGWTLVDAAGGRQPLDGSIGAGETRVFRLGTALALGNGGDTLTLVDAKGVTVDRVEYRATQVRPGRTIVFGR
jgi:endonuclease YncB( thermonuclease family)